MASPLRGTITTAGDDLLAPLNRSAVGAS